MADPKGVLDPGIDTGSKNGAVKIMVGYEKTPFPNNIQEIL